MTTRLGRLVRAPTALVALLCSLLLGLDAARADDKKDREALSPSPLLFELGRRVDAAGAIVAGKITSKKHVPKSPLGVPATRYVMEAGRWLKPAREAPAPFAFWVPGGPNERGLILVTSRANFDLQEQGEYVVYATSAEGTGHAFDVLRFHGEKEVLVDADGFALGVNARRMLVRSLGPVAPTTLRLRPPCAPTRPAQRGLPVGDGGLKAFPLTPDDDEAIPAFRPITMAALIEFITGGSISSSPAEDPGPAETFCDDCHNSGDDGTVVAWLDRPLRFYAHPDLTPDQRKMIKVCFRAWNHVGRSRFWLNRRLLAWARRKPPPPPAVHPAFQQDGRSGIAVVSPAGIEMPTGHAPYSLTSDCASYCNGKTYLWIEAATGRVVEADILIHSLQTEAQEFLKTAAHELGHALTFGHECGFISLLSDANSTRTPPAEGMADYVRAGDFECLRAKLNDFNTKAGASVWRSHEFTDLGAVASYHPEHGTKCHAIQTYVRGHYYDSEITTSPGAVLDLMGVHVENRGTRPASCGVLTFFLTNDDMTRVIGRYHFHQPLYSWLDANYQVRIPSDVTGTFKLGWRMWHPGTDKAWANDRAWLVNIWTNGDPQTLMTVTVE